MLSQELRPKTLDDMAGQEEAKKLIKAIIKNPEKAPKVLLFCGSFGTGKCVSKGTRVHTNKGYLKIEDIVNNPSYDSDGFMDISDRDVRVLCGNLATHLYYGGSKKIIKILSKEFSISGTPNHRVRVFGDDGLSWKRLDRITTDDYVAVPKSEEILFSNATKDYSFFYENVSEFDKGYFCGSVFSNLLINKSQSIELEDTLDVRNDNDDIKEYISGIIRGECYHDGIVCGDGVTKYINDTNFNIDNIPESVFSSNKEYIKGFLSSLFDYLGIKRFNITKLNKSTAIDIQNLLSLCGCINSLKNLRGNCAEIGIELSDSKNFVLDELDLKNKNLLSQFKEVKCDGYRNCIPNNVYTNEMARHLKNIFIDNYKGEVPFSAYREIKNTFNFIKNYHNKTKSIDSFYDILHEGDICNIDFSNDNKVEKFKDLLDKYHFSKVSKVVNKGALDVVYDLTVENIHSFVANGLINHNTTASRIVGRELNNIKDENYDLLNSPFYYEFDSTVVGNVEKIRELRDIFTVEYGDYWRVVVLDECVHYDTQIHVMDENGNTFLEKIGKLVSKKPKGWKALSVDDNGNFSYKPILNFFNNGKKDFYKVGIEVSRMGSLSRVNKYTKNVVCTENHRFFDDNFSEVYLRDLKVGDVVSTYEDYGNNRILKMAIKNLNTEYNLSDDVISFLRGSVLGDGSIDVLRSGSLRYRFTQSSKHGKYFDVVKSILADLYCCDRVGKSGYGGKDILTVTSRVCDSFKDIFSSLFVDGKKRITREYLDSLTPLSIATWYMDDGSLNHSYGKEKSISLSTHAYSKEENETIIEYFKDVYGIRFKLYYDKRCGRYSIGASCKEDRYKFLELVSPYVIDLFQYKLGEYFSCGNGIRNIDPIKADVYKGDFKFVGKGVIKSITPYKDSHVSAYDIEVADNHNYITSGGVILHNCHTVSATAQAAMLKMFEETKGKTIYILATTDPQKLLPTIRSRALEINFNDVPVEAIVENLIRVSDERGLNLSDEIKLLIADRSGGHMRNAHMLLDKYLLLGEEDFRDSIKSSITLFCDYLIAVYNNDKDTILNTINELLSIPKDNLQSDWSIVMTESLRSYCGFDCRHKDIQRLVDTYKGDFNIIAQCYMSAWVKNMFVDTPYTQATLLNLYKVVRGALDKKKQQSAVGVQSNVGRYGKPVR